MNSLESEYRCGVYTGIIIAKCIVSHLVCPSSLTQTTHFEIFVCLPALWTLLSDGTTFLIATDTSFITYAGAPRFTKAFSDSLSTHYVGNQPTSSHTGWISLFFSLLLSTSSFVTSCVYLNYSIFLWPPLPWCQYYTSLPLEFFWSFSFYFFSTWIETFSSCVVFSVNLKPFCRKQILVADVR